MNTALTATELTHKKYRGQLRQLRNARATQGWMLLWYFALDVTLVLLYPEFGLYTWVHIFAWTVIGLGQLVAFHAYTRLDNAVNDTLRLINLNLETFNSFYNFTATITPEGAEK